MAGTENGSRLTGILKDILFFGWMRRLYQWVLHWADTRYGEPMLGFLSFIESSFFPIPPDVLLIPLAISRPKKAFRFAAVTVTASVLGGMLGYAIGMFLWESVGIRIIQFYGLMDQYYIFREWYDRNVLAVTFLAGLTPLPYKVFTIAAGVMDANFTLFVLGSITSRSIRFFMEAVFCYFGDFLSERVFKMPIKDAIDRYLNPLAVAFAVLLVAGFLIVRYILPSGTIDLSTDANLNPFGPVKVNFYSLKTGEDNGVDANTLEYFIKLHDPEGAELSSVPVSIPGVERLLPFHHGEPSIEVFEMSNGAEDAGSSQVIAVSFFTACTETVPCTDGLIALYTLDEDGGLVQAWSSVYPRLRHIDADHDIIGEADMRVVGGEAETDSGRLLAEITTRDVRFEGKGRDRNQNVNVSCDRRVFGFSDGYLELMSMDSDSGRGCRAAED